ncbi:hypothetical protein NC651_040543 [Populus alba x Populus x berolinensis]|nr:hypothetical protein NC651_040543 [Populus alba x Populus x berolinensis]
MKLLEDLEWERARKAFSLPFVCGACRWVEPRRFRIIKRLRLLKTKLKDWIRSFG